MEDSLVIKITEDALPYHNPKKHKSSNYMTKFEYTRLLAARALQISAGDTPRINVPGIYDPFEIAKHEIHHRVVPIVVERRFPDGTTEVWHIQDINIRDY